MAITAIYSALTQAVLAAFQPSSSRAGSRTTGTSVSSGGRTVSDSVSLSREAFALASNAAAPLFSPPAPGPDPSLRVGAFYNFSDANLGGANLSYLDLRSSSFVHANLAGANFSYSMMGGADLTASNLSGADLSQALGLSADQLTYAVFDATTRLPSNLSYLNAPWSGNPTGANPSFQP